MSPGAAEVGGAEIKTMVGADDGKVVVVVVLVVEDVVPDACTCSVTDVECDRLPLVPVTVIV